jgi:hypothetical protein
MTARLKLKYMTTRLKLKDLEINSYSNLEINSYKEQ